MVGAQIHVRAFLFGFKNLDGVGRRIHHLRPDYSGPEIALNDFKGGQCVKRAPVKVLTIRLMGIVWQRGDFRGEKLGGHDAVAWKGGCGECNRIEPTKRSVLQRAVVEIEAVDVEDGLQADLLFLKNAGAAPERAAPRPAAEASRRDVSATFADIAAGCKCEFETSSGTLARFLHGHDQTNQLSLFEF